jgi:methylase of polypeptide subunit release factors
MARVVEIGCGSGAAGVFIARERPGADVTLADINQRALDVSAVNAEAAGVTNTRVAYSDILSDLTGAFDYIVSNPPYLADPAHRSYRDGGGLWGADLSLRILQQATERLSAGGCALIYTGAACVAGRDVFKHEAARLLASPHLEWTYEEIDPDVFGEELDTPAYAEVDRIAAVALRLMKR